MGNVTKRGFVEVLLAEVLRNAGIDVEELSLSEDEREVMIRYKDGYAKTANIEADSLPAIVLDVTRRAMY